MKKRFVPCLALLTAAACVSEMPKPIVPGPGPGYEACATLSTEAGKRAQHASGLGWAFVIAGVGAAAAGTHVIPLDGTLTRRETLTAASLVAGGALLAIIGRAFLQRSDAASTLAGEAAAILGERDGNDPIREGHAISRCNIARSAWDRSRTDSSEVARALLDEQKKTTKAAEAGKQTAEAEKKTAEAETKIAEAETKAAEAKTETRAAEAEAELREFQLRVTPYLRKDLPPKKLEELVAPH